MILESAPLMLESINSANVDTGSLFTIADYGCADGGTSMPLMYACVKELRKIHGDDLPIHVIYEDQPVNDFKSLFLRLQGWVLFQLQNNNKQLFDEIFVISRINQCRGKSYQPKPKATRP